MSYLGTYQSCSDTWVYTLPALDAGKSSRCPIRLHPLMASAGVRLSATKQLRKASHADRCLFVRDADARLIPSRDSATAIHRGIICSVCKIDQPDRHDHLYPVHEKKLTCRASRRSYCCSGSSLD
jgi:hypothetical protein